MKWTIHHGTLEDEPQKIQSTAGTSTASTDSTQRRSVGGEGSRTNTSNPKDVEQNIATVAAGLTDPIISAIDGLALSEAFDYLLDYGMVWADIKGIVQLFTRRQVNYVIDIPNTPTSTVDIKSVDRTLLADKVRAAIAAALWRAF